MTRHTKGILNKEKTVSVVVIDSEQTVTIPLKRKHFDYSLSKPNHIELDPDDSSHQHSTFGGQSLYSHLLMNMDDDNDCT